MRRIAIFSTLFLAVAVSVSFAADQAPAPTTKKGEVWNQKKIEETCDAQVVVAQNLLAVTKEDGVSMRAACIKSFGNAKATAPTSPAPKK